MSFVIHQNMEHICIYALSFNIVKFSIMDTSKFLMFLSVIVLGLSSCSKSLTPFTERMNDDNGWTESDLQKIQFYTSEDIVLRRQASTGGSKIENGEIRIKSDRKVDEITIRRGTPGVFLFKIKENRFAVSFEDGGEKKFLVFGPGKNTNGKYVLKAAEWNRNTGKIRYNDRTYITPSRSAYAALMVNLKRARRTSLKSRTAGGRVIK